MEPVSLTSRWIREFERQFARRKHLLLYGNVNDHCLWCGDYVMVIEFLRSYLRDRGFEIVVTYDSVDGYLFGRPGEEETGTMQPMFRSIVEQSILSQNPNFAASVRQAVSPSSSSEVPPRGLPPAPTISDRVGRPPSDRQAFSELRAALKSNIPTAVIVELADLMTTVPDSYDAVEKQGLAHLKRAGFEASLISDGPLAGHTNTLVLVAEGLVRVPTWLYRENPRMAIVHVALPEKEERRSFALRFTQSEASSSGFFGAADFKSPDAVNRFAEDFASLTEGFTTTDLEGIRLASHTESISVAAHNPADIVDQFRFGTREDPWAQITNEKVQGARQAMSARVFGQEAAIDAVTSMLVASKVGISSGGARSAKPKGVFFFVGPTGVGKTELAKALTEVVFGDEGAFARFDMSEYREEHAAEKLLGAPPGYVGYEEGGQLTNRVIERPHSILLFDEIEKAHPRIFDKFLQVLEDGRLTDGKGQTAYFDQTAIIFTSNIGSSDIYGPNGDRLSEGIIGAFNGAEGQMDYRAVEGHFQTEVARYFTERIGRAEILGRLGDNVVVFDLLRPEFIDRITGKFLSLMESSAMDRHQLRLTFTNRVTETIRQMMAEGDNMLFGGRRVKLIIESRIERPMNSMLFARFPNLDQLRGLAMEVDFPPEGLTISTS